MIKSPPCPSSWIAEHATLTPRQHLSLSPTAISFELELQLIFKSAPTLLAHHHSFHILNKQFNDECQGYAQEDFLHSPCTSRTQVRIWHRTINWKSYNLSSPTFLSVASDWSSMLSTHSSISALLKVRCSTRCTSDGFGETTSSSPT